MFKFKLFGTGTGTGTGIGTNTGTNAGTGTAMSESTGRALLAGGGSTVLLSIGALNGGAAVSASVFDSAKTFIAGQLSSTLVIMLAFIALIALIWQLSHGGGWKSAATILGVLVAGLLGPGLVSAASTAARSEAEVALADSMSSANASANLVVSTGNAVLLAHSAAPR